MKRAFLVQVPEFVLVVDVDDQDFFNREVQAEAALCAGEAVRVQRLTQEELRAHGDEIPAGCWDPDRELTCAQIAAEMPAAALRRLAERLGWFVGYILEQVA